MNHWTVEGDPVPIRHEGLRLYFDGDEAEAKAAFEEFAADNTIFGDGIDLHPVDDGQLDATYAPLKREKRVPV